MSYSYFFFFPMSPVECKKDVKNTNYIPFTGILWPWPPDQEGEQNLWVTTVTTAMLLGLVHLYDYPCMLLEASFQKLKPV